MHRCAAMVLVSTSFILLFVVIVISHLSHIPLFIIPFVIQLHL